MADEKKGFTNGELLLFGVIGQIAFRVFNLGLVGAVLPFALLGGKWYGKLTAFGIAAIAILFGDLITTNLSPHSFFIAIGAGVIATLLGEKTSEASFVIRTIIATLLLLTLSIFYENDFRLYAGAWFANATTIILHLAVNILLSILLTYYLRENTNTAPKG